MSGGRLSEHPVASRPRHWLLYALGGGSGHLMRAISLAKAAAREGIPTRILSNSPVLPALMAGRAKRLIELDASIDVSIIESRLGAADVIPLIHRELDRLDAADVLVVDTFPRGIVGEIADRLERIPAMKVFIHRDLTADYVRDFQLESVVTRYELVIVPGEEAPLQHLAQAMTSPWFVCDPGEILSQQESRRVFGIADDDDRPLVVVSGCGNVEESMAFASLAQDLKHQLGDRSHVRFASMYPEGLVHAGDLAIYLWPLMGVVPGVDLLVGAGGYHTVNEARVTGTPLLGIPHRRLYDRQAHRVRPSETLAFTGETVFRIAERVVSRPQLSAPLSFSNGAQEAFRLIEAALVLHSSDRIA